MHRSVWMMMALLLAAGAAVGSMAADKDPPPSIEGKWDAPVRWAGKDGQPRQTLEFKEGKMVWIRPRQTGDMEKKTGFRIEAEYTVSKTGRVYGMITLAAGASKADDGEPFSFMPKIDNGVLAIADAKSRTLEDEDIARVEWKRKP